MTSRSRSVRRSAGLSARPPSAPLLRPSWLPEHRRCAPADRACPSSRPSAAPRLRHRSGHSGGKHALSPRSRQSLIIGHPAEVPPCEHDRLRIEHHPPATSLQAPPERLHSSRALAVAASAGVDDVQNRVFNGRRRERARNDVIRRELLGFAAPPATSDASRYWVVPVTLAEDGYRCVGRPQLSTTRAPRRSCKRARTAAGRRFICRLK